ncbi:MAG: anhydro-N-acetylmuramic acid kinase, partial [Melioribacteraceae bacterium]|nr:anhydro-N-acetylmuramic acid kinase [Melioribacteraceae bacterium]
SAMQQLNEIRGKKKKIVIGLMSGTSVDGVDAALVEIENNWIDTRVNLMAYIEYPYPNGLKEFVLKNSAKESSSVEDICRLNFLLSKIYVKAAEKLLDKLNMAFNDIDLIGSHGQTIHHLPAEYQLFGENIRSTLQIGDPSVIAKLTGVLTVGNFRTGDMAFGGQGAPLVPYFDYLIFHSEKLNRALLNIGGISNITILDKMTLQEDVLAFDTGPGNMLIDLLMKKFFGREYDENGNTAASGKLNEDLFNAILMRDSFIEKQPPKSTGREYYGDLFLSGLLEEFSHVSAEDWLNTVTRFTAYAVYRNYEKFVINSTVIDELIISGGGAKNNFLYKCLSEYFGNKIDVKIIDDIGISSDAKEAICFAVLANETLCGNPSNIPKTTGAAKATILGGIFLP